MMTIYIHLTDKKAMLYFCIYWIGFLSPLFIVMFFSPLKAEEQFFSVVETNKHMGPVSSIRIDPKDRVVVTGSYDKTVRIWSYKTGRLLNTIHLLNHPTKNGQVYTNAISPDGQHLALGGWLHNPSNNYHILVYELNTGNHIQTLAPLRDAVHSLAYSPDGQYLVVGIGGGFGIQIWATENWRLIFEDTEYNHPVTSVDFNNKNYLATASEDGFVRLYDSSFKLMIAEESRSRSHNTDAPTEIAFNPAGDRIAVVHKDSFSVRVLSGYDLSFLYAPDVTGINGRLSSITWSRNGRVLYAAGQHEAEGGFQLIRGWSAAGRGPFVDIQTIASSTIFDLAPSGDINVAYASADSGFAVMTPQRDNKNASSPIMERATTFIDLRVSDDGSQVNFLLDPRVDQWGQFDVFQKSLRIHEQIRTSLREPITTSSRFTVTDWKGSRYPKLNGEHLKLWVKDFPDIVKIEDWEHDVSDFLNQLKELTLPEANREMSNVLAIAPNEKFFVIGTNASLNLFNPEGQRLWKKEQEQPVGAANISGDSRSVIISKTNGVIEWYRAEDGELFLSFFSDITGEEWIAWTPNGYYIASPKGDRLVGWIQTNSSSAQTHFYSAYQFERVLFNPQKVEEQFKNQGNFDEFTELNQKHFTLNQLSEIAPPQITILSPQREEELSEKMVRLDFSVNSRTLPMEKLNIFVNKIPILPFTQRILKESEKFSFSRALSIPLYEKENVIKIEVENNGQSVGLAERLVFQSKPSPPPKGNLYLLAVGVNQFIFNSFSLQAAANDAKQLTEFFEKMGNNSFKQIHTKLLADKETFLPSKTAIIEALVFFKSATRFDTVILFLASHGMSDQEGNYYFVPNDAKADDIAMLLNKQVPGSSVIRWSHFFEALWNTAGKRILIVDTCNSRNISGTFDFNSLAKRSFNSSFALLTASQGNEPSYEISSLAQGLFTYSLLVGLQGEADKKGNQDGRVTLEELASFAQDFTSTQVKRLKFTKGPQNPQMEIPQELKSLILRQ